jgi:hypothetical protein
MIYLYTQPVFIVKVPEKLVENSLFGVDQFSILSDSDKVSYCFYTPMCSLNVVNETVCLYIFMFFRTSCQSSLAIWKKSSLLLPSRNLEWSIEPGSQ